MKRAAASLGRAWILAFFLAGAGPVSPSTVAAQSRDERAVRAAYLYNLIKFVQWPAPGTQLTVAFTGDAGTSDVIGHLLDGKTSDGQTIRVASSGADQDLQHCSVLYVAAASDRDVRRTLDRVKGRGVLTVGESDAFARAGGMVALVNSGDHIRIEVNLDATQAAGILISSRMLGLATIVHTSGKGGE